MNDTPKSRFQFGIRTLLEIIAVVAFMLAIIYGKSPAGGNGRYQMAVIKDGAFEKVLALDTKTGRLWQRVPKKDSSWRELPPDITDRPK